MHYHKDCHIWIVDINSPDGWVPIWATGCRGKTAALKIWRGLFPGMNWNTERKALRFRARILQRWEDRTELPFRKTYLNTRMTRDQNVILQEENAWLKNKILNMNKLIEKTRAAICESVDRNEAELERVRNISRGLEVER